MTLTPENTRAGYQALWSRMQIRPDKKAGFDRYAKLIASGKPHYEEVEKATGVPWWFVGIIHLRESNLNFGTFLGNGEPLYRVTRLVPKGLGPWATWKDGAIEAIQREGLDKVKTWDIPTALYFFEKWNGWGYVSKGINSPYVWAGTNLYSRGKFVSDGEFSAIFIDPQPGAAAMLASMILLDLIPNLAKEVISMATTATASPAPTANTSTGVTVNANQNLATHIITGVGAVLMATGLSQVHAVYDAITNAPLIGGFIVSVLSMFISHFNVKGSNSNTLEIIDKVLVALTPATASKSPLTAVSAVPGDNPAPVGAPSV